MTNNDLSDTAGITFGNESSFRRIITITSAILFSGACWYLSTGLHGDFWYLLWVAPVPVLLISLKCTAKATFFISFSAYLIGRLSWFSYLLDVATLVPAIIFTITIPLIFATIITLTRRTIMKTLNWSSVFIFPVLFTSYEYILMKFSSDGTASSLAYTQMNFLPAIQIASVTGITGITFLVTLIPSALAGCWYLHENEKPVIYPAIVSVILVAGVLLFGIFRLNMNGDTGKIIAGLAVLDENTHSFGNNTPVQDELKHTRDYAWEITSLAEKGAQLVVLPERAINVNKESDTAVLNILTNTARQNHVYIVTGYTNYKTDIRRNSVLVIDNQGNVLKDYNKVHLVKGLERQFAPGNETGLFRFNNHQAGTAICKDLDFPDHIRKYGQGAAGILCIPAWDFRVDDWLHARMSILRGVENGFSEVRTARLGRLSISDHRGRVSSETGCTDGKRASLTGYVSLKNIRTFYSAYGDWFGIIMIVSACLLIIQTSIRKLRS